MNWRSRNRRKRQEIGLCVHCFTSPQIGEHLRHHPGFRKGMGPLIRTSRVGLWIAFVLARSSCSRRVWLVNDACDVLTSQEIHVGGEDWNLVIVAETHWHVFRAPYNIKYALQLHCTRLSGRLLSCDVSFFFYSLTWPLSYSVGCCQ